jgi:hypothetical protein
MQPRSSTETDFARRLSLKNEGRTDFRIPCDGSSQSLSEKLSKTHFEKARSSPLKKIVLSLVLLVSLGTSVYGANCVGLPSESDLKSALIASAGNHAGGLFEGTRMWAAVVNCDGEICGYSIGFCASGLSEYLGKRRL